MRVKIDTLREGDAIQLVHPDGPTHEVVGVTEDEQFPGVIKIAMTDGVYGGTFDFPGDCEVWAISQPRTLAVPCLLCKNSYPYDVDLTTGITSARGICGPCNASTTREVLKEHATEQRNRKSE